MANTRVKGSVVTGLHLTAKGIEGIEVHAYDIDPISSDDFLGKTKTDKNGEFIISYSESTYRAWFIDRNPDIVLRFYGPSQRLLHETSEYSAVEDATLDVGKIVIHENNVHGWLVTDATLWTTTGSPVRLSQGNQIEWLIDGDVFPELTDSIKNSKHWVNVTNFAFWVGKYLITKFNSSFNAENPPEGQKIQVKNIGEQLQEIMKDKAAQNIPVRIVLNNIPYPIPLIILLLFLPFVFFPGIWTFLLVILDMILTGKAPSDPDSIDEVKEYFKGTNVAIRSYTGPLGYFGFLHAKVVTIDGEIAFVMGSSLSQGYFNDPRHLIHDARHGGSLMHDVNLKLRGPAVEDVERTFTAVWNQTDSKGPRLRPQENQPPLPDGIGLQVVRTLPGDRFTISETGDFNIPYGETGVLEAYQRAIANANDFIYIEDQYFTCPEIVTALIDRMNMKEASDLQAILVLNVEPDIPGYPKKQIELIRQLQNGIPGYKDRLGIYSIWSFDETKKPYDKAKTPFELLNIYVHSKAAIVDDTWATAGSANIDGASMNESQIETILGGVPYLRKVPYLSKLLAAVTAFFSTSVLENEEAARPTQHANPQRSSQPPRQTEVNLVIYNNIAGQPPTDAIVQLREKLWRDHLGFLPNTPEASNFPTSRPSGGWLQLWRKRAEEKCKAIRNRQKHSAKILEWQHETELKKYLKALGIDPDKPSKLSVRSHDKAHKFDFEKGIWRKKE
jgi:phosphatidylserine/phosphatidylglycerophosphate/cardiolipin synthase-like enzyme